MAEHTSRLHAQVFDMFHQISLPAGDTEGCPPGILPPGWRSAYQARQRTAQVVLTLAKAAPKVCDLDPFSTGLRLCLDSWSLPPSHASAQPLPRLCWLQGVLSSAVRDSLSRPLMQRLGLRLRQRQ